MLFNMNSELSSASFNYVHQRRLSKDVLFSDYGRCGQLCDYLDPVPWEGDWACNGQHQHFRHLYLTLPLKVNQNFQLHGQNNEEPYLQGCLYCILDKWSSLSNHRCLHGLQAATWNLELGLGIKTWICKSILPPHRIYFFKFCKCVKRDSKTNTK